MESHYTAPCPTIKDLWMALNNQRDKRSKEIALALRIFATGSMQAFAQPTNVDIDVAPEYMTFMQRYKEWWDTKKKLMGASWQRDMVTNKEDKRESLMKLVGQEFVIIDVFGWPRNPDGYNKLVKRVAQKAGISDIHPHMFRHTFVSLLMSNPDIGVATVAAEAGHAQPSTTLMIYTQQYKKRLESIRNQLSRELYEK